MASDQGIEVELKFRVGDLDLFRQAVRGLGGEAGEAIRQIDTYFAHPVRDFAKTDEALRVRIVGETGCVTYKGPLLDGVTKSREETELWFSGGASDAARFGDMLVKLGVTSVRSVEKAREPWRLSWDGHEVEVALDEVKGLGSFAELETAASRESFDAAKTCLLRLAERLDLHDGERRSYLALLLLRDAENAP